MQFKGAHEPLRDIARKLNVDAIVEGTVLRSGNRVRITAQLIEAGGDRQLWTHSYERDLKDVVLLQDEVSRDVADEVRIKLTPKERSLLSQSHDIDPEAHDDYLRGRYWCGKFTMDGLSRCRDYFRRAIAKDPKYALAYAGVAESYIEQLNCCGLPVEQALPQAKESAMQTHAMFYLERAYDEHYPWLLLLRVAPEWDPIRSSARFRALVHRLGLPPTSNDRD